MKIVNDRTLLFAQYLSFPLKWTGHKNEMRELGPLVIILSDRDWTTLSRRTHAMDYSNNNVPSPQAPSGLPTMDDGPHARKELS